MNTAAVVVRVSPFPQHPKIYLFKIDPSLLQLRATPLDAAPDAVPEPTPAIEMDTSSDIQHGGDGNDSDEDGSSSSNKSNMRLRPSRKNPVHGKVEGAQRGPDILGKFGTGNTDSFAV